MRGLNAGTGGEGGEEWPGFSDNIQRICSILRDGHQRSAAAAAASTTTREAAAAAAEDFAVTLGGHIIRIGNRNYVQKEEVLQPGLQLPGCSAFPWISLHSDTSRYVPQQNVTLLDFESIVKWIFTLLAGVQQSLHHETKKLFVFSNNFLL